MDETDLADVDGDYKADCDSGYTALRNPIAGFVEPFTKATRTKVLDRGKDSTITGAFGSASS